VAEILLYCVVIGGGAYLSQCCVMHFASDSASVFQLHHAGKYSRPIIPRIGLQSFQLRAFSLRDVEVVVYLALNFNQCMHLSSGSWSDFATWTTLKYMTD